MKSKIALFALIAVLAILGLAHAKGGPSGPLATVNGWQCAGKKIKKVPDMDKVIASTARRMDIDGCTFAGPANVRVLMACQATYERRHDFNLYGMALFNCPNADEPGSFWYGVPASFSIRLKEDGTPAPALLGCGECMFCGTPRVCIPWVGCVPCACIPDPVCWARKAAEELEKLVNRLKGLASDYYKTASNWVNDAVGAAYTFVKERGTAIVNDLTDCVTDPKGKWSKCANYVPCLNLITTTGDPTSKSYWEQTANRVAQELQQCKDGKPEMCTKYAGCLKKLV